VTFFRDFFGSIIYFIQNGLYFACHLAFHIVVKLLNFISNVLIPTLSNLLYDTLFMMMIIYQGVCEVMTLICISMSRGFIKMGNFFNDQSEKLITKNWM